MVFGRGRKAKRNRNRQSRRTSRRTLAADPARQMPRTRPQRPSAPSTSPKSAASDGYVDLGALLIAPREGLQLRLEVEEATQRVVAVTMDLEGSSLQLQAFAAPRSEGLWDEIREQIGQSVGSQGGQVEESPRAASAPNSWPSCRPARPTAARATGWPVSSASTAPAGSSAASSAARQPWTVTRRPGWRSCSGRSWWSAARTPCRRATCCSCACPRTLRRPVARLHGRRTSSSPNADRRSPRLADAAGTAAARRSATMPPRRLPAARAGSLCHGSSSSR